MAAFLGYAGWTFLPDFVTGWTQTIWYSLTIRAGEPKPQPGSANYIKHRRRIHVIVISIYLLYTFYEAHWEIRRAGDYYADLGIDPDIDERGIKSRFRRLAAQFHPDKIAQGPGQDAAETKFVKLKSAQEVLLDPTKRFAYDRFGPEIMKWQHMASVKDYLFMGLQTHGPYYVAGILFLGAAGLFGYLEWGRYWRFIFFGALLIFEVITVTRPHPIPFVTKVLNPFFSTIVRQSRYLPFQQLIFARKIVVTISIAFSQLGPLIAGGQATATPAKQLTQAQQFDRLDHLTRQADQEGSRVLGLELSAFAGDEAALADVKTKMSQFLVQNVVRNDPEVRNAVGEVMKRRRVGAPAGAKGTK